MENDIEYMMVFLYDDAGSPVGFLYRTSEYAKNAYDAYFYEKNCFGDVIAIYNESGSCVARYAYNAWGEHTVSYNSNGIAEMNPIRYRGYYYDTHTGLYYLQSRYYNPLIGRFISPDCYVSTGQGLLGSNMYIYCNNNPVMYVDPTGEVPRWLAVATDVFVGLVAEIAGTTVAVTTFFAIMRAGGDLKTALRSSLTAKVKVTGGINNAVNAIYYEFCDPEDTVDEDSYHGRYLTRWERLRDAKKETKEDHYSFKAWMYYSEYSLHMWGWYATGWALDKGVPIISDWAKSTKTADVQAGRFETGRPEVMIPTIIIGLLGW